MSPAERPEHYFAAAPATRSRPRQVELALPDRRFVLDTDRGVFSAEQVDVGTRYLLLEAPMPPPQRTLPLLDLGCGYGPIALALAQRAPLAPVYAVDVNERARELCRSNAERAGLGRIEVCDPAAVPADVRFGAIYSNPPIRIGNAALHELLVTWLARLEPVGLAVLVVHKHLGADSLQQWLIGVGFTCRRLGSRLGYRLLEVRPSAAAAP